jgi:cytochrome c-type biogenesis protein CcmH
VNPSLTFNFIALVLVLSVAAVLVWVLLRQGPLVSQASQAKANAKVYRDQIRDLDREHESGHLSHEEWQQSRDELSLRLLEDTSALDDPQIKPQKPAMWSAIFILLAVPLSALGLYAVLGEPAAFDPMSAKAPQQASPMEMLKMAENLAQKLEEKPDNLQGWVMLGRTYRSLEQFDKSIQAYDRALKLSADDDLQLERVEVIAMKTQGNFEGEPWRVIRDILQRDPQHYGALLMAGSGSFAHAKYEDALRYWLAARKTLDAQNPDLPELDKAIASVQEKLGLKVGVALGGQSPVLASAVTATADVNSDVNAGAKDAGSVSGQVNLSAALKSKASPSDVVFIYATPANGERMPLAIFKTTVSQLPLNFTLDDSTAMSPQRKLSGAGEVFVKVRVSKSGNAMPQSGDLSGSLGPVKVGAKGLTLEIKDQVP